MENPAVLVLQFIDVDFDSMKILTQTNNGEEDNHERPYHVEKHFLKKIIALMFDSHKKNK